MIIKKADGSLVKIEKFNPNHCPNTGKFTSKGGSGAGGGTKQRGLKEIVSGNGSQEERADALYDLLSAGGAGWHVTRGNTVVLEEDTGGQYMSEVKVTPKRGGHFDTEFVHSDGVTSRETYDSVGALSDAAAAFMRRERFGN